MSIPKDGYYTADVQLDTGVAIALYVNVNGGRPHDENGKELLPEACSNFCELDAARMVRVWPQIAAMELDTLRAANAGLEEKVASLEKENARLQAGGCARDQRTTQFCAEAVSLAEKVRRLKRSGDALSAAFDKEWLNQGDIESLQDDWDAANE